MKIKHKRTGKVSTVFGTVVIDYEIWFVVYLDECHRWKLVNSVNYEPHIEDHELHTN